MPEDGPVVTCSPTVWVKISLEARASLARHHRV